MNSAPTSPPALTEKPRHVLEPMNEEFDPRPAWQRVVLLVAIVAICLGVFGSMAIAIRFWQA